MLSAVLCERLRGIKMETWLKSRPVIGMLIPVPGWKATNFSHPNVSVITAFLSVCLSACLPICLTVCMFVFLLVYLSVTSSVCWYISTYWCQNKSYYVFFYINISIFSVYVYPFMGIGLCIIFLYLIYLCPFLFLILYIMYV